MKLLILALILTTTSIALADSNEYCPAMNGVENIAKCYQIAPLANKDVIRFIVNLKDEVYQKMALEAVEINPTQLLSADVSICVWRLNQGNDGLMMTCLENLKNTKNDIFIK